MHLCALLLLSAVSAAGASLPQGDAAIGILEADGRPAPEQVQNKQGGVLRQMAGAPAEGSYLKKRQAALREQAAKEEQERLELLRLQLAAQQVITTTTDTATATTVTPTGTTAVPTTTTTAITTTTLPTGSTTLTVTSTSSTSVFTNTTSTTSTTSTITTSTRPCDMPRKMPCNGSSMPAAGLVLLALAAASALLVL